MGLNVEALTAALSAAARQAIVTSPDTAATGGKRDVRWGDQLDIQTITSAGAKEEGELTDQKVAGYVAKYATKALRTPALWTDQSCAGTAKAPATTPKEPGYAKAATVGPPPTTAFTTWLTTRTPRP